MRTFILAGVAGIFVLGTILGGRALIGERIDPGHAGLLVNNYGDSAGVTKAKVFLGGRVSYNPWTQELFEFPTFNQTLSFEEKNGNQVSFSAGGSQVKVNVGFTYRFKPEALPEYFADYRVNAETFTNGTFYNGVRDCLNRNAVGKDTVQLVANASAMTAPLQECLEKKFGEFLIIDSVSILDNPVTTEAIQASIDKAVQARQDAITAQSNAAKATAEGLATKAKAEAESTVQLINAKAEAEANRIVQESLTPELLQFRLAEMRHEERMAELDKWKGEYGTTIQTPVVQNGNTRPTQSAQ